MPSEPKVLFIALDAASRDLVRTWCDEGLLPNLRALARAGASGPTVNAPAVYTGSLWPSVWTGTTPGRHGCYYCEQLEPGTYEIREFVGRNVEQEPFWNALSRAGRRVALLDVPKAAPCEDLNGVQVVDWGTHDADVPACSYPPALIEEIHARHGASPFRRCDWVIDRADGERTLREELLWRIDAKVAIAEDLLRREPWDLFMVGFGDSHCVGHQCWHLHDPSHPRHDPALRAALGDPIRDVYEALDRAVGRLLAHAGPDTTVLVLCSHGMAAHYDATYLLDDVLRRLEGTRAPASRALLDRARRLWKRLPLRFTERFARLARAVDRLPDASDRSRRRCFVVPTNANSAGIRLNVVGREPAGLLRRGREADEFVAWLAGELGKLTEASSGRPLVKEVLRSAQLFPGEHTDLLPDLFVRWHRDAPIHGASSPSIGTLVAEDRSTRRTGDHRNGGLYLVRGPGIAPGGELPPARDEDFAPTLAALLGVPLAGVDGRPLLHQRV
ncbi:MAG: alkaline phosphatase family protein [Thermodesulfobacteriota bacterium]